MTENSISKHYNSIYELPTQVTSALDETDQQKWMDEYNRIVGDKNTKEAIKDAKEQAWMSVVDAPSSLAVETWASVEVRDADGELVPIKTITDNLDRFINNSGLMHDSHSNVPVGTVWGWEERKHPETGQDGVVVYFNINRGSEVFDRARDDILEGRKRAVSIGAEAPRGGYKCDDRGCYVERDVTDLYEISICETPANPEAYFINVGKDIVKSHYPNESVRLHVKDILKVHENYDTCPLQLVKHNIRKALPDATVHMNDLGIISVKGKDEAHILDTLMKMKGKEDYVRYDIHKSEFEFIPGYLPEDAVSEAIDNEWACTDAVGHILLTKKIPKETFCDWYDRGFLVKVGDLWTINTTDIAKEGGAMGVGDAGAVNAVYGKKVSEANRITGNSTHLINQKKKKKNKSLRKSSGDFVSCGIYIDGNVTVFYSTDDAENFLAEHIESCLREEVANPTEEGQAYIEENIDTILTDNEIRSFSRMSAKGILYGMQTDIGNADAEPIGDGIVEYVTFWANDSDEDFLGELGYTECYRDDYNASSRKGIRKDVSYKKMVSEIDEVYGRIYNLETEYTDLFPSEYVMEYSAYVDKGDVYIGRYPNLIHNLIEERGDLFTSDREVASLAVIVERYLQKGMTFE